MKNILVVLADQLRRDALGCYGDPNVSTPNIDRLAERGFRFDAACSTNAVCVPFRYTLMTGQYSHTGDVPQLNYRMPPEQRTVADELNEAGYHTVYVGKWHLDGCQKTAPIPPERQGRWQKWLGFELRNSHFDTWYFEDDDPEPKPLSAYQTDGLFDLAMDYLAGPDRPADQPFCCVLSVEPPHFPYEAPDEYEERWRGRDIELPATFLAEDEYEVPLSQWPGDAERTREEKLERLRTYYAMIENLDDNVGRMMEFLQEQGMTDDTTIVLTSDHGEMGGMHALPTAMKEYPFEESIGIPLIVADPSAPSGCSTDVPVCTEDLYPTLCGLAGTEPDGPRPGLDLAPVIRGEQQGLDRPGVMLEAVREERPLGAFYRGAFRGFRTRTQKYTVLRTGESSRPWQFFDLEQDPLERNNLVTDSDRAEDIRRLHNLLARRIAETDDDFPMPAPPF
jgi:arylsulfatase A-like enzyme